jgi:hypothetical protein
MTLTLRDAVDAFERTSLDDRLFIVMPSNEELDVCIQFDRKDQFRCWTFFFRDAPEESKQNCSRVHFIDVAKAFQINENELTKELAGHLLTQAAFADQFVREIQELLGEDAVRESIIRTQLFMDALKDAVSSSLNKIDLPPISEPVDQHSSEAPPPESARGLKLRVVKGP